MSKRESKFTTELKHSFEEEGIFIHKIADMPHNPFGGARFDIKKPFDCFGVMPGIGFAIEAKAIKREAFAFSSIRENQVEGLNRWERSGGASFIFVNARDAAPRINKLFVFHWSYVSALMKCGDKSIKWKDLEVHPHIDGKGERYDIEKILHQMFYNGGKQHAKGSRENISMRDV